MRLLASLVLAFTLAIFAGLGATWYVTTRGISFGTVRIGTWVAHPKAGTTDIDPYARAIVARSGELPLGSGDGLMFLARKASDGRALDGRCDIVVSGSTPLARFWTLTLHDSQGRLVANPVSRYGFTSVEVLRQADGKFEIVIAPQARPGNWLPSGGADDFLLAPRLYDTSAGVNSHTSNDMPTVTVRSCP